MSPFYLRVSRVQTFPPPPILSRHPPLYDQPIGPSLQVRLLQQSSSKPHINPSVLVIVIILSVVFICSGILHILARCLGRRRSRAPTGSINSPNNSIRGQLQHLFTLHDSGVEQVFIDTLPVFLYGSIRGLKDSADCAVCLNEFANEDRLRLLPKCKHAFHLECIDTWLLSNSTCPLCRRSLLPEAEAIAPASDREHGGCIGRLSHDEPGGNQSQRHGSFRGSFRASLRGSFRFLTEAVAPPAPPPPSETPAVVQNPPTLEETPTPPMTPGPTVLVTGADGIEKVLRVELGKVNIDPRRITRDVGTSTRPRSYSMGSYEYVVDFSSLELAMQPTPFPGHPQDWAPSKPTHRSALSDSIPELASASQTQGKEDMFWASRGLDTPHDLSRIREIMTPSPVGRVSSPKHFESRNSSAHLSDQETDGPNLQRVVNIDPDDDEEDILEHEEAHALFRKKGSGRIAKAPAEQEEAGMTKIPVDNRPQEREIERRDKSLSFRHFPVETKMETSTLQQTVSDTAVMQEIIAASRKDKVWEVSVDVTVPPLSAEGSGRSSSSKRLSTFGWLRGRGRRLVYSAASPSSTDMLSTESKS